MSFLDFLRDQPVFTLFLVLGVGQLIGRLRIGVVTLGPVAGVLFAGLGFGYLGFTMAPGVQAVGFALFIFTVGYQAGPRFFDVVKANGAKYLTIAMIVSVTGVILVVVLTRTMGFDPGTSGGLLAGGLTSSPTLAAAQEAISGGSVVPPEGWSADQVIGNITTSYAITYIFGLAGLILIIKVMPSLLGIDLAGEARSLEAESQAAAPASGGEVGFRAYRVTNEDFTRMAPAELRALWDGFSWVRLRRGDSFIDPGTAEHLELDDEVLILGPAEYLSRIQKIGEDVSFQLAETDSMDTAEVVVQRREVVGQTLAEIDAARSFGVYVAGVQRMGHELARESTAELRHGDVLHVVGPAANIDDLAEAVGEVQRGAKETDLLTLAIGIAVGVFLGTLSVTVGNAPLSLGSAGGLLVSGIVIGFGNGIRPTFGRFPEAARSFLMDFGLQLFMIGVGLRAGSDIVETFSKAGPQLIGAGIVVTVVPLLIAYVVGRTLLRLSPVILFGAITGAMTSGAALSVVTGEAKSDFPALGYTGTYAFANVLLTIAGPLVIVLA